MYIITLTYKVPLSEIERHLQSHRNFLDEQYKAGIFLASGPKNPRIGGVIISTGKVSRSEINAILGADPFYVHELADYEIIEFTPVKYHEYLKDFV